MMVNLNSQLDWDRHIFDVMIPAIESKSKDPSTKVGCVITTQDNTILICAFNGFPRGVEDNILLVPERYERPDKYLWTVHAEQNGINTAAGEGVRLRDCKIWVRWHPCARCAGSIIQSKLSHVIIDGDSREYNDPELKKRWGKDIEIAEIMFKERGTNVRVSKRK